MRNRWEGGGDSDLDAPATITERELRALRRRAGFGVFAVMLSCVAVGGLGWTLYAGPTGLERIQGVKERMLASVSEKSGYASETRSETQTQSSAPAPSTAVAADSVRVTEQQPVAGPVGQSPVKEAGGTAAQGTTGH